MTHPRAGSAPYHHGDLRASLVAEGMRQLAEEGAADLSLRRVAREIGVSATAVYRHFPDRDALLSAIAEEGFRQLSEEQKSAFEASSRCRKKAFQASGAAYVRFALKNPAMFRLMFSRPTAAARRSEAANMLRRNAAALAPKDGDHHIIALQAWSIAHGLALLMLDGLVPVDEFTIEQVFGGLAAKR